MIEYFGNIPHDLRLEELDILFGQSLNIEVHQTIDSTNTRIRELLSSFELKQQQSGLFKMVCADQQTAGRGRLQRAWWSPAGQNTYTSFAVHFPGGLDLSGLSLAVGLSLRRVLVQQTGLDIFVKWPNDVLTAKGKLAGILIEALHQSNCWIVIIGIGINVNMSQYSQSGESHLSQACTSLAQELGHPLNRAPLIAALYQALHQDMLQFLEQGWQGFLAEWQDVDWLAGSLVNVYSRGLNSGEQSDTEPDWQGRALGVDHQGRLLIEGADRVVYPVLSGDVSVRLAKNRFKATESDIS